MGDAADDLEFQEISHEARHQSEALRRWYEGNRETCSICGACVDREIELRQRIKRLEALLDDHAEHSRDCILSFFEAGRPTPNGGYEQQFKGKWYQVKPIDNTPKCECGLDEALSPSKQEEDGR